MIYDGESSLTWWEIVGAGVAGRPGGPWYRYDPIPVVISDEASSWPPLAFEWASSLGKPAAEQPPAPRSEMAGQESEK
jgi:hypothetical protein